jgi:hydroxymethylpyrimidine pyrophosphatase-like HAD family hydrolase
MEVRPKTVAFDLDGTVLEYDEGMAEADQFGSPIPGMVSEMRKLWKDGWKIIIWTCRPRSQEMVDHLNNHRIPFHEINVNTSMFHASPKIYADVYVDDRAISFNGDTEGLARRVKEHQPWNKR